MAKLLIAILVFVSGCASRQGAWLAARESAHFRSSVQPPAIASQATLGSLTPFPAVISALPVGHMATTFHFHAFDPSTTRLRGLLVLSNATDRASTNVFCLDGGNLSYHIALTNASGRKVSAQVGFYPNWWPRAVELRPYEAKSEPLDVVLADYFQLTRGVYQVWFQYDECMLGRRGPDCPCMRRWSTEALVVLVSQ
jgi:hypothetical protein